MIIADGYFGTLNKSKNQRKRAFKIFEGFLNNSVVLKLDLTEDVDFSYDDEDEIKTRCYQKRHLELMEYSTLEDNCMEYWNMHAFSNHIINTDKIKICYLEDGTYKLSDIFNYCLDNTKNDIENVYPILWDYINSRK